MATTSNANNVLQIVEEQSSAMVNLSDTLQTSLKLAETLKALYATK